MLPTHSLDHVALGHHRLADPHAIAFDDGEVLKSTVREE